MICGDGTFVEKELRTTVTDVNEKDISKNKSFLSDLIGWIFSPIEKALRLLEEIFTGLLLSVGDGILVQLSNAVGEQVTIDRVVFGEIEKVSIDFWGEDSGYMAKNMGNLIVTWYNTFTAIATSVYLTVLLAIGVKILYSSTGSGKAKYQMLLVDWVVGVALLFFFPSVMRVAIDANTGLVRSIKDGLGTEISAKKDPVDEAKILSFFGTNNFVKEMTGEENPPRSESMMYVRNLAGSKGRIPLAIVYLIMVFQTIIILFVYYKRAFMTAFLIIIFPLVAMTYTMDKLRWWSNEDTSV